MALDNEKKMSIEKNSIKNTESELYTKVVLFDSNPEKHIFEQFSSGKRKYTKVCVRRKNFRKTII